VIDAGCAGLRIRVAIRRPGDACAELDQRAASARNPRAISGAAPAPCGPSDAM